MLLNKTFCQQKQNIEKYGYLDFELSTHQANIFWKTVSKLVVNVCLPAAVYFDISVYNVRYTHVYECVLTTDDASAK